MLRPAPVTIATLPTSSFSLMRPLSTRHPKHFPGMTKNLSPQERQIDFSIEQLCKLRNRRPGTLFIPSAMARIEHEFFLDVRARERFVRPAAEMRLSLLYDSAVVEYRANVAGEIVRIRIIRVDHVTDFRRERENILVAHRSVREGVKADAAAHKACGEQKRR